MLEYAIMAWCPKCMGRRTFVQNEYEGLECRDCGIPYSETWSVRSAGGDIDPRGPLWYRNELDAMPNFKGGDFDTELILQHYGFVVWQYNYERLGIINGLERMARVAYLYEVITYLKDQADEHAEQAGDKMRNEPFELPEFPTYYGSDGREHAEY